MKIQTYIDMSIFPKKRNKRGSLTTRLPPDLMSKLVRLCEENNITIKHFIEQLIQSAIDQYETQRQEVKSK